MHDTPPLNRGVSPPQQSHSSEQSNKELLKQQQERAREASGEASDEAPITPAAAAAIDSSSSTSKSKTGRHTCPECEHTWPQHYGPVCHKCQHDLERAQRRKEELAKAAKEMEEEHRLASKRLPGTGNSFAQYKAKPPAPHVSETALKEKEREQEEYKRAQAELPEIEDSLKSMQ